ASQPFGSSASRQDDKQNLLWHNESRLQGNLQTQRANVERRMLNANFSFRAMEDPRNENRDAGRTIPPFRITDWFQARIGRISGIVSYTKTPSASKTTHGNALLRAFLIMIHMLTWIAVRTLYMHELLILRKFQGNRRLIRTIFERSRSSHHHPEMQKPLKRQNLEDLRRTVFISSLRFRYLERLLRRL
ncbi:MAG: hypothetical protein ABI876_10205, partial [Bacteroidota bacterium]